MYRLFLPSCAALVLGPLAFAQGTLPAKQGPGDLAPVPAPASEFAPGQLIVRFASGEVAKAICTGSEGRWTLGESLFEGLDLYLVHLENGLSVMGQREVFNGTPGVLYAMENGRMSFRQTTPNDPMFAQQSALHNTGQTGGVADADIDAIEAWDIARGSDEYVVAIVDSGGLTDHEDLIANRWENLAEINGMAGVDDDNNGYVDDFYGWNSFVGNGTIQGSNHATRVAGIVGARGDNGLGGSGVLWETDLMYVTLSPINQHFFYAELARAFEYVTDQKVLWRLTAGDIGATLRGANVVAINASWGIGGNCQAYPYYLWNDLFNQAGAVGILTVGATASSQFDVDQFGDIPSGCLSDALISVTMTDALDELDGAYGPQMIDLAAPGISMVAPINGNNYDVTSATSWAAPVVTGAVALMHDAASQQFKDFYIATPQAAALVIKQILIDTVDPLPSLQGVTVSGGRLNLRRALQAIASYGPLGETYCQPSNLNSAGQFATLQADGDLYVSENSLSIEAQAMPQNQFGYFLVGNGQAVTNIPGSQGSLCVSGMFGRFNRSGQIKFSGAQGAFALDVDLSNLPTSPASTVLPGETWNFQAWYRDQNPGPTSNFTEALEILFL